MPTYDYECESCAHRWEEFASIKAPATKICPECHKETAKRLIGAGAGILFKGSGFYITDYRSDSYKKGAAADKSASPGGSGGDKGGGEKSGGAAKSESKPAPKGD